MKLETGRILIFSILSNSGKFLNLCGIHYFLLFKCVFGFIWCFDWGNAGVGAAHEKVRSRYRG